jgi:cell wall-associated NlpC family hydrolase
MKNMKKYLLLISFLVLNTELYAKRTKHKDNLAEYIKNIETSKIPKISKTSTSTSTSTSKKSNHDVIKTAKKYLGRKYRYGRFDCSKFVQTVIKKSKKKILPRTTRQQIKVGKIVSKNKAKKGDLIFFGDSKHRVGHVGIIINPKKMLMIHNSSAKGKVTISSYNTKYYKRKYRGIRRV